MKTEKIYTEHAENETWMNNVAFYRDEISIMQGRLQELASKNTSRDVLKQVEHFQNQFIIQKQRLDELKHHINLSNDALSGEIAKTQTVLENCKVKDHAEARKDMHAFERLYAPLKKEFNTFLSKWM